MTLSPMQQDYVTKGEFGEFKNEMRSFRRDFDDFSEDMYDFKDEIYLFRDNITNELSSFKGEMSSFKSEMYLFRTQTEKRFDKVDRQIAELRQEIPRHMGILREGFRDDLKIAVEFVTDRSGGSKKELNFDRS